jgi:UDP-N-acetylglucosamine:LPS N-acetylglucosamine transferase
LQNAMCLAQAGAATVVTDRGSPELNAPALRAALVRFMEDEPARFRMSSAAAAMGRPAAADEAARYALGALLGSRHQSFDSVKGAFSGAR